MTDQANNTNDTSNGEIRENLREAGDALLAAGSAPVSYTHLRAHET